MLCTYCNVKYIPNSSRGVGSDRFPEREKGPALAPPLTKNPVKMRAGDRLRVGPEVVTFGRNILLKDGAVYQLQHRLFVNDPWELMAEAIALAVLPGKTRDTAQSFRLQAEDYFRAATSGRDLAVRPVLLYYAFLNLSKAYGVPKGNASLASKAFHGISCDSKPKTIPASLIWFPPQAKERWCSRSYSNS